MVVRGRCPDRSRLSDQGQRPSFVDRRGRDGDLSAALGAWGMVLAWRSERRPLVLAVVFTAAVLFMALPIGAIGGHDNPRYLFPLTALWIPFAVQVLIERLAPLACARTPASLPTALI